MCKCTPSIRTPFCGKLGCEWPKPVGTRERTDSEIIAAMGLRMVERPEISDEGRAALREKHRRNSPTHDKEIHGTMSDEWVANAVRMLMRNDLDHEAIVVAARDRIMRLSLQVERLRKANEPRASLSTGCKDKNGREIFEGDRVNVTWLAELGITELDCEEEGTVIYMVDGVTPAYFVKFDRPYKRYVAEIADEPAFYDPEYVELFNVPDGEDSTWHFEVISSAPTKTTAEPGSSRVITPVFILCNAYESGFGHGGHLDKLCNPYTAGGDEFEAYAIGYDEGARRRRNNGSSQYCLDGRHAKCEYKECMCACHLSTSTKLADEPPDVLAAKDWLIVLGVLHECQIRLQEGGVRHSWIDGAIGICEYRSKDAVAKPAAAPVVVESLDKLLEPESDDPIEVLGDGSCRRLSSTKDGMP